MRFLLLVPLMLLVGCTGQVEPRIAGAQTLAIQRIAYSNQLHNRLHDAEQGAYRLAKKSEADGLFRQSIQQAKADAEADPAITKSQLADEILRRVEKRDQNITLIEQQVALMDRAQSEANKPFQDAAELMGLVLQFEKTEGFSYTELINSVAPLVPTPIK